MIAKEFSLLLCTNGHQSTRPALEYGVWLAGLLKKTVTLLGIDEDNKYRTDLEKILSETAVELENKGISFEQRIEVGHGTDSIARVAHAGNYLTIAGPLGRPAWRRVVYGRSFRRLLAKVETPILYVPNTCLPLKRILICVGGLAYAHSLEHFGLLIAQATGATITLLHVVEPINLDYPTSKEIHNHLDNILASDTPQAKNLRNALAAIQAVGVSVDLKIRHGSIVHEIIKEVELGDYDLIGLGSPYSTKSLRHLYTPNVTAEVAESVHRPILAVRMGQSLVD